MAQLSDEIKRAIADALQRPIEAIPDEETNPTAWAEMMKELREQQPGLFRAVLNEAHSTGGSEGFRAGAVSKRIWQRAKGIFFVEVEGARAPNKKAYGTIVLAFLALFVYAAVVSMQASPSPKQARGKEGVQFEIADGGAPLETTANPIEVRADGTQEDVAQENVAGPPVDNQPAEAQKPDPLPVDSNPVAVRPPADQLPPLDQPSSQPNFLSGGDPYGVPGSSQPGDTSPRGLLYDADAMGVITGGSAAVTGKGGGMLLYEAPKEAPLVMWEASN